MMAEGDASEYRVIAEYRLEWSSAVDDTDVSVLAVTSSLPDVSRPLSLHDGVPEVGIDVWSYGFPAGSGECAASAISPVRQF